MHIVEVYKTSKGIFSHEETALLKKNRNTYGSDYKECWENVERVYVLKDYNSGLIFELGKPVEIDY